MTIRSDLADLTPKERDQYGFARVRDIAFDAVQSLWRRRRAEGITQVDLANAIGRDTAWVSKNLRGPGNWTLRTFGALVEGLGGAAEIIVRAAEDPPAVRTNYDAYLDFDTGTQPPLRKLKPTPATAERQPRGPVDVVMLES
jgi:hypothetical protein